MIKRRGFIAGILTASLAPAVVRPKSLMPLWVPRPSGLLHPNKVLIKPEDWRPDEGWVGLLGPDGKEVSGKGYTRQAYAGGFTALPPAQASWGLITHVLVKLPGLEPQQIPLSMPQTVATADQFHLINIPPTDKGETWHE